MTCIQIDTDTDPIIGATLVCMYVCVYMCICACVRACTHVCACVYVYVHAYVCACMHVYICVCGCDKVLINYSSDYYDSYGFSHKHLLEDSVAVESISGMVNQQLQLLEVSKYYYMKPSNCFCT